MERNPMARRRCCVAERERDIAIDEAATAYYELGLLREEVAALRREKEAWEAGKDAWSQRHQHLLWHVGNMAEVLWHAMYRDDGNGTKALPAIKVEEARLLALHTLEQLTIKSDAQLYEEMHDLYAKIAHMETQQSRLMDKIRELKALNDAMASTAEENAQERRGQRFQTEERTKLEHQRPVEPVLAVDNEPLPREAIIATGDPANPANLTENESVVALLQAQLAMYVSYSRRKEQQQRQYTVQTEQ